MEEMILVTINPPSVPASTRESHYVTGDDCDACDELSDRVQMKNGEHVQMALG